MVAPTAGSRRARGAPGDFRVSAPETRSLELPGGHRAQVWEKGSGPTLGFLGGLVGLPRWPDLLERLAARHRVVAPALPGSFGAESFRQLDDLADWVSATLDLLDAANLVGVDLVGASLGATLAAEVAAFSPASVERLVLISPFGLFDPEEPVADPWAVRKNEWNALVSSEPDNLEAFLSRPEGVDEVEWEVQRTRCQEASARLLWPTGDLGIAKRLHRIRAATLLVWGEADQLLPQAYADRFARGIAGETAIRRIAGAGHTAELDRPQQVAQAIADFLG